MKVVDSLGYIWMYNKDHQGSGPMSPGFVESDRVVDGLRWTGVTLRGERDWDRNGWPKLQRIAATRNELNGSMLLLLAVLDSVDAEFVGGAEVRAEDCVFRRVRVSGRLRTFWAEVRDEKLVRHAREVVLGDDDGSWWLDVSDLHAEDLDLRGLPADRVRIDPERQAFVCSDDLVPARDRLGSIDLPGVAGAQVRWILDGKRSDAEFINVPRRRRTAVAERALLAWLHAEGLTMATYDDLHPGEARPMAAPPGDNGEFVGDDPHGEVDSGPGADAVVSGIVSSWYLASDRGHAMALAADGSWLSGVVPFVDEAPIAALSTLAAAMSDLGAMNPIKFDVESLLLSRDEPLVIELPETLVAAFAALTDEEISRLLRTWEGDSFAGAGDLASCRDVARTAATTNQRVYGTLQL